MSCRKIFPLSFLFFLCALPFTLEAQMPSAKPNPLIPGQGAQEKAGCSTKEASACAEAAAKILPIVLGASPLEEKLRRLTDEIGGRVTGTPQMARAVEWGVGAFRTAGVDVHTEKYMLPVTWSEGKTELRLLEPFRPLGYETTKNAMKTEVETHSLHVVSVGWGPPTPESLKAAEVIDVGYGSDDEFRHAGNINGAFVLVHSDIGSTWADLFGEYMRPPAIIDHAVKGSSAGILWMGARERLLLYRH